MVVLRGCMVLAGVGNFGLFAGTCVCVYVCMHVYMCICMYACIYVCMYMYACACMYFVHACVCVGVSNVSPVFATIATHPAAYILPGIQYTNSGHSLTDLIDHPKPTHVGLMYADTSR
jgi:hypothetical protein